MAWCSNVPSVLEVPAFKFQFDFNQLAERYQFCSHSCLDSRRKWIIPEDKVIEVGTVLNNVGIKINQHGVLPRCILMAFALVRVLA